MAEHEHSGFHSGEISGEGVPSDSKLRPRKIIDEVVSKLESQLREINDTVGKFYTFYQSLFLLSKVTQVMA